MMWSLILFDEYLIDALSLATIETEKSNAKRYKGSQNPIQKEIFRLIAQCVKSIHVLRCL